MTRKLFLFLSSIILFNALGAQISTVIHGKVYDTLTNEPMPFVNIMLVGTHVGTVSDIDGNYSITTALHPDSIRATYIGYDPIVLHVKYGVNQLLNIPMHANTITTGTVVIHPGENPAVILLRKVWAHKPQNDVAKLDAYQYEVYNKLEFDLNNITKKFQDSKVMKPVKFIFDDIDSTNPNEKPNLPLFFSESISEFYYRKSPRCKKEVIEGSKVSGVKDASISQFSGDMYQNVNIYNNNIEVFGKIFVSPISENGVFYYRYYLVDSMSIDGHWCYQIQFKPRRKQELLFTGNVWIADSSFAVKRLEMSIAPGANIDFVNAFNVIQEYSDSSGAWMLSKERVVGDFSLKNKQMGFYGRKTTSYSKIIINQPQNDDFYTRTDNLVVLPGADDRNDSFWLNARHDSLTRIEKGIYARVDSVQHLPIYKTWQDLFITFGTGYKTIGPIDAGPLFSTMSYNRIEGYRFRLGARTSDNFSKWCEFSGYSAYGLSDDQFKYGAGFRTYITKKPRQLTGVNYKNDYEVLGLTNNIFTPDNIFATLLRRSPVTNFTRVEQYEWWYDREWFTGFDTKISFVNRNMFPIGANSFLHPLSDGTYQPWSSLTTSEIRFTLRLAYDEKYIENTFSRVSMGTKYPILQMQYTAGLKGIFNSDYNYHKLIVNVDDRIHLNPFGYLNYTLEAGKIWGVVPYPLMVIHPGNQTYVYDWSAYNMMNYLEFVSDQYASAILIHHFDGLFLNHIPLMRKLKWREIASFHFLMGSVSDKNKNEIQFPQGLYSLNKGPYMEAGVGIENIFRFFRVDAFWRLTYLDHTLNGKPVSPFGIRVSVQLIL